MSSGRKRLTLVSSCPESALPHFLLFRGDTVVLDGTNPGRTVLPGPTPVVRYDTKCFKHVPYFNRY